MRRALALAAVLSACATAAHTRLVVPYATPEPIGRVAVEAVNSTGRTLALPGASLVSRVAQALGERTAPEPDLTDVFASATSVRLEELGARVVGPDAAPDRRVRVTLRAFDLQNDGEAGAIVFVTATYELSERDGQVLWKASQDRLPARLTGPNLSRYEVSRIAAKSVESGLASLGPSPR
jgi:hypothetical protein